MYYPCFPRYPFPSRHRPRFPPRCRKRPSHAIEERVHCLVGLGQRFEYLFVERDRLQAEIQFFDEEAGVGDGSLAATGSAHALEKRRYGARRVGLEDAVEIAYVDPELQR